MVALIEAREVERDRIHRQRETIVPWVFFDDSGAPLYIGKRPKGNFRRMWQNARNESGLPGRFFHDLRRTAVRNLDHAGVSRATAMELVGLKTDEIWRRYDIVDERDLERGVEALASARVTGTPVGTPQRKKEEI